MLTIRPVTAFVPLRNAPIKQNVPFNSQAVSPTLPQQPKFAAGGDKGNTDKDGITEAEAYEDNVEMAIKSLRWRLGREPNSDEVDAEAAKLEEAGKAADVAGFLSPEHIARTQKTLKRIVKRRRGPRKPGNN